MEGYNKNEKLVSHESNFSSLQNFDRHSDYEIAFTGESKSYCVGIVDMVDSTRISANLHEMEWCKYYSIFLNSMSKILRRFGGAIIKNGGDSLLYYFPDSSRNDTKYGLISCLDCSLTMCESHEYISEILRKEKLPPLNFRVSSDYGRVVLMKSSIATCDLIGPPVNMCAKINGKAHHNGVVIGGDLYELVKGLGDYLFKHVSGFSIGLKYTYPIYEVQRRRNGFR